MSRINLLPWRARRREKRQKHFLATLVATALISAAAVGSVYFYFQNAIEFQVERNNYLRQETAALDIKIEEIKELDAIKAAVIQRIQIIEQLQLLRPQIVHLFDEWLDTLPEGVYLTGIEQLGPAPPKVGDPPTLTSNGIARIRGTAQSNGRVSTYMNQLDASEWLADPQLVIIQTKEADNGTRASQFTLTVQQRNPLLDKLRAQRIKGTPAGDGS